MEDSMPQYGAYRLIDHAPSGVEAGTLAQECLREIDAAVNASGAALREKTSVIIKPFGGGWSVGVKCSAESPYTFGDGDPWDAGCRTD
jgi:hypothetical protein